MCDILFHLARIFELSGSCRSQLAQEHELASVNSLIDYQSRRRCSLLNLNTAGLGSVMALITTTNSNSVLEVIHSFLVWINEEFHRKTD